MIQYNDFTGIRIFEGTLGGGKTYAAVEAIASHLGAGLTVFTNIEIDREKMCSLVRARYGLEMESEQLIILVDVDDFHKNTPSGQRGSPVLGVIDEAHLFFNARDWKAASKALLEFLTLCRKLSTNLIFISQSAQNIDAQFRRLVGSYCCFRDLQQWTIPGLGVKYSTFVRLATLGMSRGPRFLCCLYDRDQKTLLQKDFREADKRVYEAYKTESLLVAVNRSGTVVRRTLRKTPARNSGASLGVVAFVVFLVVLAVCGWRYWTASDGGKALTPWSPREGSPSVAPAKTLPLGGKSRNPVERITDAGKSPLLEVAAERFVAFYGGPKPILRTSVGAYELGEMSAKGYVRAVSDRRAVVFNGTRNSWVVAEEPTFDEVDKQREANERRLRSLEDSEERAWQRLQVRNAAIQKVATFDAEPSEFAQKVGRELKQELDRPVGGRTR